MKKLNLNVIHLTRRNDEKNTISYRMVDSEEILQSWVNIVRSQRIIFPGSSILIKGKVAKLLKYKEKTFSDDNEFGRLLRKSGYKWIYFASLQTHEKAPDTVRNLFKQRKNWYKVGMVHFFYYEFSVSILITIISMMGWLLLFNPSSVYGLIMYPMLLNGLIMEIIANMVIGRKNFFNSLLDTFAIHSFIFNNKFCVYSVFYNPCPILFKKDFFQ